jgi:hypothetical protein
MCGDEVCSDCSAECSECNLELCVPCKEAGVCCSPHMITPVEGCSNGHDYTDDWGSENSDTESQ